MNSKDFDLVESYQRSFLKVGKVKFGLFFTWRQFTQSCLITFSLFTVGMKLHNEGTKERSKDGFD